MSSPLPLVGLYLLLGGPSLSPSFSGFAPVLPKPRAVLGFGGSPCGSFQTVGPFPCLRHESDSGGGCALAQAPRAPRAGAGSDLRPCCPVAVASLALHGLPHAAEGLARLHGGSAGHPRAGSQHHRRPAEGAGHRPRLRGLPLHVRPQGRAGGAALSSRGGHGGRG